MGNSTEVKEWIHEAMLRPHSNSSKVLAPQHTPGLSERKQSISTCCNVFNLIVAMWLSTATNIINWNSQGHLRPFKAIYGCCVIKPGEIAPALHLLLLKNGLAKLWSHWGHRTEAALSAQLLWIDINRGHLSSALIMSGPVSSCDFFMHICMTSCSASAAHAIFSCHWDRHSV